MPCCTSHPTVPQSTLPAILSCNLITNLRAHIAAQAPSLPRPQTHPSAGTSQRLPAQITRLYLQQGLTTTPATSTAANTAYYYALSPGKRGSGLELWRAREGSYLSRRSESGLYRSPIPTRGTHLAHGGRSRKICAGREVNVCPNSAAIVQK